MNGIEGASLFFGGGRLSGGPVERLTRRIGDLGDIFSDSEAYARLPVDRVVYEVESHFPVAGGTEGGLFVGITYIHPGKVGQEYFMTKGHFHAVRNRAEVYICIEGEGMLILMNEDHSRVWAEKMEPGSIHYINGHVAHRTANTGSGVLSFGAVWPSDAGHDYQTISEKGFSKILVEKDGVATLVNRP
ncbi:glucose-6-phosphate isomerase family protein [Puia sp. P3]|uniref:glucose-6-phosphate isomerase family protein n=1 Tax=Puia sp. P3 TaxID=3423952 RepID=UPI003D666360